MQSKHFSQPEFEFAISKYVTYGDEEGIADNCGISGGMLSQYLNPNDERESQLFKAAATLAGWIEKNEDDGRKALSVFNSFVCRAVSGDKKLCIESTRERSYKERTDFHLAEATGESTQSRIDELEESIEADTRLLEALRASRQLEIPVIRMGARERIAERNAAKV